MTHESRAWQILGENLTIRDFYSEQGATLWSFRNKVKSALNLLRPGSSILMSIRIPESGHSSDYDAKILSSKKTLRIRGYFQSYRYLTFTPQGAGCEEFPITDYAELEIERLGLDSEPWASLHVRLGDFKALGDTVGVLSPSYYADAIRLLKKNYGIQRFVVFSDEPAQAISTLKEINLGVQLENAHSRLDAHSTLSLLSRSHGSITGNSTFSYWGAAKNPTAQVVVNPWPWFKSAQAPKDFLPPNWVRLQSRFK